jgi:hypothetical protein
LIVEKEELEAVKAHDKIKKDKEAEKKIGDNLLEYMGAKYKRFHPKYEAYARLTTTINNVFLGRFN